MVNGWEWLGWLQMAWANLTDKMDGKPDGLQGSTLIGTLLYQQYLMEGIDNFLNSGISQRYMDDIIGHEFGLTGEEWHDFEEHGYYKYPRSLDGIEQWQQDQQDPFTQFQQQVEGRGK